MNNYTSRGGGQFLKTATRLSRLQQRPGRLGRPPQARRARRPLGPSHSVSKWHSGSGGRYAGTGLAGGPAGSRPVSQAGWPLHGM